MFVRHALSARLIAVAFSLLFLLPAGVALAETEPQNAKNISYKAEVGFPPYKYFDDTILTGFDIDFTRLMFLKTDYNVIFYTDKWPVVFEQLKNGEIDTCGLIAVTDDRKGKVLFSKPLLKSHMAVYARKGGLGKSFEGLKLSDLKKYRVGTGAEQSSESILVNRLGIKPYKTYTTVEDELFALEAGEIDLVFEDQEVVNYLLVYRNLVGSIEPRITDLYPVDIAYGVRKDYPELVSYMNKRITALMNSGVYEELYQRYFFRHSDDYYSRQKNSIIVTIATIIIGVLGLLAILQLYIRRLRKRLSFEQGFSSGIINNAEILIVVSRMDGTIILFNRFAEEITGYSSDEVVGKLLPQAIMHDGGEQLLKDMQEADPGTITARQLENRVISKDGSRLEILWNINLLCDTDKNPLYIVSMGMDITEHKRMEYMLRDSYQELEATHEELVASEEELQKQYDDLNQREEELRLSEERYRLAVEGVNDGIWDWDARNGKLFMSKRCRSMLGYDSEKDANTIEIWRDFIHDEDVEKFLRGLNLYLTEPQKKHFNIEYRTKSKDGKSKWIRTRAKAIWSDEGKPIRLAGSNTDITEQKLTEEKIHHLAYYDSLTGLPNKTLFVDRFTMAIANAQRKNRMVALYFFDLDNFKTVNDTLGHTYGDELLSRVGDHLRMHMRKGDTIARLGGDEFIMMQSNIKDISEVTHLAARILEMFQKPWILNEHEFYVTASIGVSIYPNDGTELDILLKNADAAMYRAKEIGKNNFQLFTSELNSRIAERIAIENSLRKAIERNEMQLVYQPQIDLETGRAASVEALLRWHHPDLGTILPEKFIPLAEESGLIVTIGEWVLRNACRQIVLWHENGMGDLRLSINISPRQFQQSDLLAMILSVLGETGAKPEWIELEITESIAMKDLSHTISVLKSLKDAGIGISLDDFGTGYSSLNYLKRLPINNLKIDKAFVDSLTQGSNEAMIVKALISLAHNMHLVVTAEGVETGKQLEILRKEKCDMVQGYFFGYPKPADELDLAPGKLYL